MDTIDAVPRQTLFWIWKCGTLWQYYLMWKSHWLRRLVCGYYSKQSAGHYIDYVLHHQHKSFPHKFLVYNHDVTENSVSNNLVIGSFLATAHSIWSSFSSTTSLKDPVALISRTFPYFRWRATRLEPTGVTRTHFEWRLLIVSLMNAIRSSTSTVRLSTTTNPMLAAWCPNCTRSISLSVSFSIVSATVRNCLGFSVLTFSVRHGVNAFLLIWIGFASMFSTPFEIFHGSPDSSIVT